MYWNEITYLIDKPGRPNDPFHNSGLYVVVESFSKTEQSQMRKKVQDLENEQIILLSSFNKYHLLRMETSSQSVGSYQDIDDWNTRLPCTNAWRGAPLKLMAIVTQSLDCYHSSPGSDFHVFFVHVAATVRFSTDRTNLQERRQKDDHFLVCYCVWLLGAWIVLKTILENEIFDIQGEGW